MLLIRGLDLILVRIKVAGYDTYEEGVHGLGGITCERRKGVRKTRL